MEIDNLKSFPFLPLPGFAKNGNPQKVPDLSKQLKRKRKHLMRSERQNESFICCHCSPFRVSFPVTNEHWGRLYSRLGRKKRFCVPIGGLWDAASSWLDNDGAQSLNREGNLINCLNYSGLSPSRASPWALVRRRRKRVEDPAPGHVISIFFASQHSTLTNIMSPRAIAPICLRLKSFLPSPADWLTWIQCASRNNLANPFVEKLSETFGCLIIGLASWGQSNALLMSCTAANGFRYRLMSPDFNRDSDVWEGHWMGVHVWQEIWKENWHEAWVVCARASGTQLASAYEEDKWAQISIRIYLRTTLQSHITPCHWWQNTFWLMLEFLRLWELLCRTHLL